MVSPSLLLFFASLINHAVPPCLQIRKKPAKNNAVSTTSHSSGPSLTLIPRLRRVSSAVLCPSAGPSKPTTTQQRDTVIPVKVIIRDQVKTAGDQEFGL
ncbi:hypothetical protein BDY19DRAFT_87451 [Irpex rosettiformis]|uniref:Uncharacterized protein n=1 Tax=Irpex rosettiformis TaxID=378272 RepID=A0ACB8U6H9_9APHY|nr:hypothetical protein BDY19DRAFT_87451 [Irpex rosettiformis]